MKMLSTQAILLVYMCVGFYCNKKEIIDRKTQAKMTDFVLRITLPCMIFRSFNMKLTAEFMKDASFCLATAFVICSLGWLAGKFLYNRYPYEKKSILQYATLVNNASFLGLPIVSSVIGEEGLALAAIFIIPNRIFMWTAGISIFSSDTDKKSAMKKVLVNPCMIAVYLGLIQAAVQFPIPEFAGKAIAGIGNCTTSISMILIGSMMTALTPESFKDWSTVYLGGIRLLLLPAAALVIMKLVGADEVLTACGVILTAMPAGSTTALLAEKYGADSVYGSKCVLTNTLFSLATIPLITLFV